MDRKKFLLSTGLSIIGLSTFGSVIKSQEGTFTGDCQTTNDILGPFYRPKAPERSDLTFEGLEGTRIQLKGKVYDSDCVTPLPKALVEIWHCDSEGEYDNDSDAFRHRAVAQTDDDGTYVFKTILPGKYKNGRLYRPAHIHYRVTAEGKAELISQIYFRGDPHIEEDPWASMPRAELRILEIIPEDINGGLSVNFNVNL